MTAAGRQILGLVLLIVSVALRTLAAELRRRA